MTNTQTNTPNETPKTTPNEVKPGQQNQGDNKPASDKPEQQK
jgi:hypothetical protein